MKYEEKSACRQYARVLGFYVAKDCITIVRDVYMKSQNDTDVPDEIKDIIEAFIDGYQDKLDYDDIP